MRGDLFDLHLLGKSGLWTYYSGIITDTRESPGFHPGQIRLGNVVIKNVKNHISIWNKIEKQFLTKWAKFCQIATYWVKTPIVPCNPA